MIEPAWIMFFAGFGIGVAAVGLGLFAGLAYVMETD